MIGNDQVADFPYLPQYGEPVARCQGGLPDGKWMRIVAIVFCVLLSVPAAALCLKPLPQEFKEGAGRWLVVAVLAIIPTITAFVAAKLIEQPVRKTPLFVFNGGIHFDERVRYMIADGSFVTFYSGARQVSLPWRVLSQLQLREKRSGDAFTVTFRLPDGRTMQVETADGPSEARAARWIAEKLAT